MPGDWATFGILTRKNDPSVAKNGSKFTIWTVSDLDKVEVHCCWYCHMYGATIIDALLPWEMHDAALVVSQLICLHGVANASEMSYYTLQHNYSVLRRWKWCCLSEPLRSTGSGSLAIWWEYWIHLRVLKRFKIKLPLIALIRARVNDHVMIALISHTHCVSCRITGH